MYFCVTGTITDSVLIRMVSLASLIETGTCSTINKFHCCSTLGEVGESRLSRGIHGSVGELIKGVGEEEQHMPQTLLPHTSYQR